MIYSTSSKNIKDASKSTSSIGFDRLTSVAKVTGIEHHMTLNMRNEEEIASSRWHVPIISALRRQRQEDFDEVKFSLNYRVRLDLDCGKHCQILAIRNE